MIGRNASDRMTGDLWLAAKNVSHRAHKDHRDYLLLQLSWWLKDEDAEPKTRIRELKGFRQGDCSTIIYARSAKKKTLCELCSPS